MVEEAPPEEEVAVEPAAEEPATVEAAMEAEPLAVAEEEPAVQEVKLSKKALKGMEKKAAAEAAAAAAAEAGDDAETAEDLAAAGKDQSGRKGMTRRVASFDDKPAGFAYLKLDNGQLRFRNQEVRRGDAPRT